VTECDEIENNAKKGKATPGPTAYKDNKLKFLPSIGKGHMSLAA